MCRPKSSIFIDLSAVTDQNPCGQKVRFCLDGYKEKSTGQTGDSYHHNVAGAAKICPALLTWSSPKNCHVFTFQNCRETTIFELQGRVFGSEFIALLGQLHDFFP